MLNLGTIVVKCIKNVVIDLLDCVFLLVKKDYTSMINLVKGRLILLDIVILRVNLSIIQLVGAKVLNIKTLFLCIFYFCLKKLLTVFVICCYSLKSIMVQVFYCLKFCKKSFINILQLCGINWRLIVLGIRLNRSYLKYNFSVICLSVVYFIVYVVVLIIFLEYFIWLVENYLCVFGGKLCDAYNFSLKESLKSRIHLTDSLPSDTSLGNYYYGNLKLIKLSVMYLTKVSYILIQNGLPILFLLYCLVIYMCVFGQNIYLYSVTMGLVSMLFLLCFVNSNINIGNLVYLSIVSCIGLVLSNKDVLNIFLPLRESNLTGWLSDRYGLGQGMTLELDTEETYKKYKNVELNLSLDIPISIGLYVERTLLALTSKLNLSTDWLFDASKSSVAERVGLFDDIEFSQDTWYKDTWKVSRLFKSNVELLKTEEEMFYEYNIDFLDHAFMVYDTSEREFLIMDYLKRQGCTSPVIPVNNLVQSSTNSLEVSTSIVSSNARYNLVLLDMLSTAQSYPITRYLNSMYATCLRGIFEKDVYTKNYNILSKLLCNGYDYNSLLGKYGVNMNILTLGSSPFMLNAKFKMYKNFQSLMMDFSLSNNKVYEDRILINKVPYQSLMGYNYYLTRVLRYYSNVYGTSGSKWRALVEESDFKNSFFFGDILGNKFGREIIYSGGEKLVYAKDLNYNVTSLWKSKPRLIRGLKGYFGEDFRNLSYTFCNPSAVRWHSVSLNKALMRNELNTTLAESLMDMSKFYSLRELPFYDYTCDVLKSLEFKVLRFYLSSTLWSQVDDVLKAYIGTYIVKEATLSNSFGRFSLGVLMRDFELKLMSAFSYSVLSRDSSFLTFIEDQRAKVKLNRRISNIFTTVLNDDPTIKDKELYCDEAIAGRYPVRNFLKDFYMQSLYSSVGLANFMQVNPSNVVNDVYFNKLSVDRSKSSYLYYYKLSKNLETYRERYMYHFGRKFKRDRRAMFIEDFNYKGFSFESFFLERDWEFSFVEEWHKLKGRVKFISGLKEVNSDTLNNNLGNFISCYDWYGWSGISGAFNEVYQNLLHGEGYVGFAHLDKEWDLDYSEPLVRMFRFVKGFGFTKDINLGYDFSNFMLDRIYDNVLLMQNFNIETDRMQKIIPRNSLGLKGLSRSFLGEYRSMFNYANSLLFMNSNSLAYLKSLRLLSLGDCLKLPLYPEYVKYSNDLINMSLNKRIYLRTRLYLEDKSNLEMDEFSADWRIEKLFIKFTAPMNLISVPKFDLSKLHMYEKMVYSGGFFPLEFSVGHLNAIKSKDFDLIQEGRSEFIVNSRYGFPLSEVLLGDNYYWSELGDQSCFPNDFFLSFSGLRRGNKALSGLRTLFLERNVDSNFSILNKMFLKSYKTDRLLEQRCNLMLFSSRELVNNECDYMEEYEDDELPIESIESNDPVLMLKDPFYIELYRRVVNFEMQHVVKWLGLPESKLFIELSVLEDDEYIESLELVPTISELNTNMYLVLDNLGTWFEMLKVWVKEDSSSSSSGAVGLFNLEFISKFLYYKETEEIYQFYGSVPSIRAVENFFARYSYFVKSVCTSSTFSIFFNIEEILDSRIKRLEDFVVKNVMINNYLSVYSRSLLELQGTLIDVLLYSYFSVLSNNYLMYISDNAQFTKLLSKEFLVEEYFSDIFSYTRNLVSHLCSKLYRSYVGHKEESSEVKYIGVPNIVTNQLKFINLESSVKIYDKLGTKLSFSEDILSKSIRTNLLNEMLGKQSLREFFYLRCAEFMGKWCSSVPSPVVALSKYLLLSKNITGFGLPLCHSFEKFSSSVIYSRPSVVLPGINMNLLRNELRKLETSNVPKYKSMSRILRCNSVRSDDVLGDYVHGNGIKHLKQVSSKHVWISQGVKQYRVKQYRKLYYLNYMR